MRPFLAKFPRFTVLVILTIMLLIVIAIVKPHLIGDDIHKISLATIGLLLGFYADSVGLPYARPDGYLVAFDWRKVFKRADAADFEIAKGYELVFAIACLRRGLAMLGGAYVIGVAM